MSILSKRGEITEPYFLSRFPPPPPPHTHKVNHSNENRFSNDKTTKQFSLHLEIACFGNAKINIWCLLLRNLSIYDGT
jgi:hypothetical protein